MCKGKVLDNGAILKILGTSQLQMQRALLPKRKAKSRRLGVRLRRLSGCETKAWLTPAMVAGFWVKIQTYESNGTFRAKPIDLALPKKSRLPKKVGRLPKKAF